MKRSFNNHENTLQSKSSDKQNQTLDFENEIKTNICDLILELDKSIRYVGIISDGGKIIKSIRNKNTNRFLNNDEESLSLIHVATKANLNKLWDDKLGKTKFIIEVKEKVKLITIFFDSKLLVLSTEISSNHDQIIIKIQDLILK
ncbi:MAG: hypothetical protein HY222_02045 [Thaumarchaeota archaeon]|nr:hypothetical protein [Nitrososphaerota archaeon]MBI3641154.1 hypothetical protein [Nitrososphaerota archaeon]